MSGNKRKSVLIISIVLIIVALLLLGYSIFGSSLFPKKDKGTLYDSNVTKIEFQGYSYSVPKKNAYELYTKNNLIIFYTKEGNEENWTAAVTLKQIDGLSDKNNYTEDDFTAIEEHLKKESKEATDYKVIQIDGVDYIICQYLNNKDNKKYLFAYTPGDNSYMYEIRLHSIQNLNDYTALFTIADFLKSRVKQNTK